MMEWNISSKYSFELDFNCDCNFISNISGSNTDDILGTVLCEAVGLGLSTMDVNFS